MKKYLSMKKLSYYDLYNNSVGSSCCYIIEGG
jgi:hypothetical protein